jgi:hypothetical protein
MKAAAAIAPPVKSMATAVPVLVLTFVVVSFGI